MNNSNGGRAHSQGFAAERTGLWVQLLGLWVRTARDEEGKTRKEGRGGGTHTSRVGGGRTTLGLGLLRF